ncbi:hypothetical protein NC651_014814 [Populus alba x Populus x berolinensis]|nr:hypothetical protein NC651_014814 [Populus alba x Populus x berolinensis]
MNYKAWFLSMTTLFWSMAIHQHVTANNDDTCISGRVFRKPGAYPLCPPAAVKDAGIRPPQDYKIRDIGAQVPTSLFLTIIFDEFRKPLSQ